MLLSVILASITLFTPTPVPTPLKVIVTVRSGPLCTALHRVILPFVKTEKQNNESFVTMDKEWEISPVVPPARRCVARPERAGRI